MTSKIPNFHFFDTDGTFGKIQFQVKFFEYLKHKNII